MGKIAVITRASRGIGAAAARILAENGYDLALSCRKNMEMLQTLAGDLEKNYRTCSFCFCGDRGSFQQVFPGLCHYGKRVIGFSVLLFQLGEQLDIQNTQHGDQTAQKNHHHQQNSNGSTMVFGRLGSAGTVDTGIPGLILISVIVHKGYLKKKNCVNGPLHRRMDQLTSGMVKVNSVVPSRLDTEIFSPWLQTMVLTM